ncbi:MAG: TonB-dependent receptor [Bacteroidota bacterium]
MNKNFSNQKIRKPLLPFLLFCFLQLSTYGQIDSIIHELPNIIIKENRLEMPFSEISRNVEVITSRQIEVMPVQSVNEVLQFVSGIDLRQRGPNGVQADVSIRGGTFDQVVVLINGIKVNDPQTGHHIMNLPIDMEHVERIEVLKGPSARIYGQNGFAGAINIVTKVPTEQFVKIRLQAGENQLGGAQVSATYQSEKMNHYFSFSKDFSQGYRFNTDYDITNIFYQNDIEVNEKDKLQILSGFTERRFGANGFYASPDFMDQYEAVKTGFISANYTADVKNWKLNPRFSWRHHEDEYFFVRDNPSLFRNLHISNTFALEFHASNENKLGTTGIGMELNQIDLRSNNLGDRSRFIGTLFFEHRFRLLDNQLDITPGFSLNSFSDFGTRFFPGLDLGFRLNPALKVFANLGYTYRVPTYTDLYYEDRANLGNPDLQPEEAFTYEIGFKHQKNGVNLTVSYFNREGTDLIDWIKEADTLQWQPTNINRLTAQGIDASLSFYLPLVLGENSFLQRFNIGYTYIDAEVAENEAPISRYALENLNHQLVAGLSYRIGKRFTHTINFRYIDRVTMDDYTVVDTRLNFQANDFKLFLNAANLFDTEYRETNLVDMPGRWVRGGVEVKF